MSICETRKTTCTLCPLYERATVGTRSILPAVPGWLAEAQIMTGRFTAATELTREAIERAEETGAAGVRSPRPSKCAPGLPASRLAASRRGRSSWNRSGLWTESDSPAGASGHPLPAAQAGGHQRRRPGPLHARAAAHRRRGSAAPRASRRGCDSRLGEGRVAAGGQAEHRVRH